MGSYPTALFPFEPLFILDTDVPSHAIGAVLSQRHTDRLISVIAFVRKSFSPSERNYFTTR